MACIHEQTKKKQITSKIQTNILPPKYTTENHSTNEKTFFTCLVFFSSSICRYNYTVPFLDNVLSISTNFISLIYLLEFIPL